MVPLEVWFEESRSQPGAVHGPLRPEEKRRPRRPLAGPQVGVFVPSDPRVRERFGARWSNFGFGFGPIRATSKAGAWSADFSFLSNRRNRSEGQGSALVVPFGAEYRIALGEPSGAWRPYAGGTAGAVAAWLTDAATNTAVRGRLAPSGGGFVGVAYGDRAYLEVHGYAFGSTGGWSAGGWNLAIGIRF